MIVSIAHKTIYLGVPHTGSSFIHEYIKNELKLKPHNGSYKDEKWLWDNSNMKHATLLDVEKKLIKHKEDISTKWQVFFVLRNGLDSYISKYFLLRRCEQEFLKGYINSIEEWQIQIENFSKKNMSLDDFILSHKDAIKNHDSACIKCFINADRLNYDLKVFTYENQFEVFFKTLCESFGIQHRESDPINSSCKQIQEYKNRKGHLLQKETLLKINS